MCFPFILLWCALSREMLQAQNWPLSCFSLLLPGFVWWIFLSKTVALQWRVHWVQGFIGCKHSSHSSRGQLILGLFASHRPKEFSSAGDTFRVTTEQKREERLHAAYIKRGSTIHHAPPVMKSVLKQELVKRRRNTKMFYLNQLKQFILDVVKIY